MSRLRFRGTPLIPVVGPSAAYNGTAGSGATGFVAAPVDPVRTTPKPPMQWMLPPGQRFADNILIGVDSHDLASAKFWVEGVEQTVTTPQLLSVPDANGNTTLRFGYWIRLNLSAFLAKSTTGAVRICCTGTSNDGTMTPRVIGPDVAAGVAPAYPMILYPRATVNDFPLPGVAGTIGPTTGTYATVELALAAAATAGAEAPWFKFVDSGFYSLVTSARTNYAAGKGFCLFTADTGVNVTLGRSTLPAGATGWNYDPRYDRLEFRGAGITFDYANLGAMVGVGHRANGINITDSAGAVDDFYWNFGKRPNCNGFTYVEDSSARYVPNITTFTTLSRNNDIGNFSGHCFTDCQHFVSNRATDVSALVYRTPINAIQISYSGPSAVATVAKNGSADAHSGANNGTGTLVLTDDNGTLSITLGYTPADTYFRATQVKAAIEARSGWSCTVLSNARRAAAIGGNGFGATSVKVTPLTADYFFDEHTDWWQAYHGSGNPTRENVIGRSNAFFNPNVTAPSTQVCLLDNSLNDVYFLNEGLGAGDSTTWTGGRAFSNVRFIGCSLPSYAYFAAGTATIDAYCKIMNCVLGNAQLLDGATFPEILTNNYITPSFQGVRNLNTGGNSGNVIGTVFENTGTVCFTDPTHGDFTPKGPLLTNLKAPLLTYDGLGNIRANPDAVGAWKVGAVPPAYPFV